MPERTSGEYKHHNDTVHPAWKTVPKLRQNIADLEQCNYSALLRGIEKIARQKLPDTMPEDILLTGVNGQKLKSHKGSGGRIWTYASTLAETRAATDSNDARNNPFKFAYEEGSALPAVVLYDRNKMIPAAQDPRVAETPAGLRFDNNFTFTGDTDYLWMVPEGTESIDDAMLAVVFYREPTEPLEAREMSRMRDDAKLALYAAVGEAALGSESPQAADRS